jgi:hypothetical protein
MNPSSRGLFLSWSPVAPSATKGKKESSVCAACGCVKSTDDKTGRSGGTFLFRCCLPLHHPYTWFLRDVFYVWQNHRVKRLVITNVRSFSYLSVSSIPSHRASHNEQSSADSMPLRCMCLSLMGECEESWRVPENSFFLVVIGRFTSPLLSQWTSWPRAFDVLHANHRWRHWRRWRVPIF